MSTDLDNVRALAAQLKAQHAQEGGIVGVHMLASWALELADALERAKPVLDAARAFRTATLSGERYDLAEHIGAIALAVDAAGHTKAVAEVKAAYCNSRHAPEGQTYELECELPAGHKGDHGALKNTVVWFDEVPAESTDGGS